MSFELVIDHIDGEVNIALLRDKKLIELHHEKGSKDFVVGDIYYGKVKKIVPSLNAAFVDVGYEKDAFLHYLDLGPQFASQTKFTKNVQSGRRNEYIPKNFKLLDDIDKEGKIGDVLSNGQELLVQVAKEPISSKGPRLSAELTIAGRYLVLVPFSNKVSISQKIRDFKERDRLRDLMSKIRPENCGVIIRTVAQNKKVTDLESDLKDLIKKWKSIYAPLKNSTPPKRMLVELGKSTTVIRDLVNNDFTNIHVNDEKLYDELLVYLQQAAPEKAKILKMYYGRVDIFEQFGINRQIKTLFGRHVPLSSGGYLIVEHTEAMHVIDVNSGNRKAPGNNQEQNAIAINLEAAEELARLFRLRDMGGIIAVDFIDMHEKENNRLLFDTLKELMKSDRAKHNILPPSKFGVVEITRQRVRPVTDIKTAEKCPVCDGAGEVQATILLAEEIENSLRFIIDNHPKEKINLTVHPFLESYFTKGIFSKRWKWFANSKKWVNIEANHSYHFMQYNFTGKNGELLEL